MERAEEHRDAEDEVVRSIFMHPVFESELTGLSFDISRGELLETCGSPARSGPPVSDPVLGEYGCWDRFHVGEHVIHFQFQPGEGADMLIALMLQSASPQ